MKKSFPLLTFLLFMFGACTPSTIPTIVRMKPLKSRLEPYRNGLAVLPFAGTNRDRDESIVSEIEINLNTVLEPDGTNYFKLVDRVMTQRVLNEQVFDNSGAVMTRQASRIGNMVGAKGLLTGTFEIRENKTRKTVERSKYSTELKKSITVRVRCEEVQIEYFLRPRLIDVETGEVKYTSAKSAKNIAEYCEDRDRQTYMSPSPMMINANTGDQVKPTGVTRLLDYVGNKLNTAQTQEITRDMQVDRTRTHTIQQMLFDIAPYYAQFLIKLIEDVKGMTPIEQTKFKDAISFAKGKRLDRACEMWQEMADSGTTHYSLTYSLAMCHEAQQEWEKALPMYMQADRMIGKPNAQITNALTRVQNLKRNQNRE